MTADDEALCDQLEREVNWGTEEAALKLPLWHYTDQNGLVGILRSREIWASHFACMNDPRELTHGEDILVDEVGRLASELAGSSVHVAILERFVEIHPQHRMSARPEAHTFVASLCTDGDSLLHWREYGRGGAGYSIALSRLPPVGEDLTADLGFFALPLEYDETAFRATIRRRFLRNFEDYSRFVAEIDGTHWEQLARRFAALLLRTAGALSVSYKHGHFQQEAESRFVAVELHPERHDRVVRPRRRGDKVVHYVRVPLAAPPELVQIEKVLVGPLEKGRAERHASAVDLLRSLGYPDAEGLVGESDGSLV